MSKQSVKIVSGWSAPGGSTLHHIALTNLLNDNGFDCTFYGPQEWHLDKCKSGMIYETNITVHDIIISHFIQLPKVNRKKHILSCHETNLFPLKDLPLGGIDIVQFVSNSQRKWQGVNHPSVVIPPIVETVSWEDPSNNIAGVIGSIDAHKQPHLSVEAALKDGFEKVLLYGQITDKPYYDEKIAPLLDSGRVTLMNHEDNRERLYGSVCAVYHSSKRETYGLVEAECRLAGVPFRGPSNNQEILSKEEVLERWKKVLQ